jgi:gliding motility-associated lipoprotein GldH
MNRHFKFLRTLYYSLFVMAIASCSLGNESLYFSSFSDGWQQDNPTTFTFTPSQVDTPMNLFLYLRNNDSYPFANIHLITELEDPLGHQVVDTLSYRLAQPNGEWLGEGLLVKESKLWYKEKHVFSVVGEYHLHVRPAMRHNEKANPISVLKGITDLGLGIEQITVKE